MAGQLLNSEIASAPLEDDLPDKPYFYVSDDEDKKTQEAPKKKAASRQESKKPIIQNRTTHAAPTYRPAYVPPAPVIPKKPEPAPVDVSSIVAGINVVHKSFGTGTVVSIQKGTIVVSFGGEEKKFQFPGAFLQGFLRKS